MANRAKLIILAFVALMSGLLIWRDLATLYLMTAGILGALLITLVRRFPAAPLYLLLILSAGVSNLYRFYAFDIRVGPLGVGLTDPIYLTVFLCVLFTLIHDPRCAARFRECLTGGILLGGVFAVLIAIGLTRHGQSAVGEFRHYVGAFIPFYCLSLNSRSIDWIRVLRNTFWLSAAVVIPMTVVAVMNGARPFSPDNRFLIAETHLWIAISLLLLAVPGIVGKNLCVWILAACYVFLLISDSHRSVWLFLGATLLAATVLGSHQLKRLRVPMALGTLVLVPVLVTTLWGDTLIGDFIAARTTAFFSPADDPTAAWRMRLWQASWEVVKTHPWTGLGMGGYFRDVWLIFNDTEPAASLHNLYLMLLLKGGPILLTAYGLYMLSVAKAFRRFRKSSRPRLHVFSELGLAVLLGISVWQIPYGVSVVPWMFLGAFLAVISQSQRISTADYSYSVYNGTSR